MGTLSAIGINAADAAVNTLLGLGMQKHTAKLNEQAAQNADARTRALYHDLYSPAAQAEQLRQAGLSVGLMYAKSGIGGSGQAGAQAAPAQFPNMNVLDLMNAKLMQAQIDKTNAETSKIEQDTKATEKGIEKTDAEIESILTQNELTKSKVAYQDLENKLAQYELQFKSETIETDIEQRKVELAKMVEDYRTAYTNAERSEIQLDIENSTSGAKIRQELQKVVMNDLQIQMGKQNIKLTDLEMQKIQEDIIEKRLNNAWIDIKNEEDIQKLRHDIQMDLYDLGIKDRQQNYQMAKGVIDSFVSIVKLTK